METLELDSDDYVFKNFMTTNGNYEIPVDNNDQMVFCVPIQDPAILQTVSYTTIKLISDDDDGGLPALVKKTRQLVAKPHPINHIV